MKFSCLFIAAVLLFLSEPTPSEGSAEFGRKMHADQLMCFNKTDVDVKKFQRIDRGDFDFDDENSRVFVACVLLESGVISAEGVVNHDTLIRAMGERRAGVAADIFRECKEPKGDDINWMAWNFMRCFSSKKVD